MRLKRLLALSLAGLMTISSVGTGDMKAFAAESSAFAQEETLGEEWSDSNFGEEAEYYGDAAEEDAEASEDAAVSEDIVEAEDEEADSDLPEEVPEAADVAGEEATDAEEALEEEVLSDAAESATEAAEDVEAEAADASADHEEEVLGAGSKFTSDDFELTAYRDKLNVHGAEMFGIRYTGSENEEVVRAFMDDATYKWTVSDPSVLKYEIFSDGGSELVTVDSFSGKGEMDYGYCQVRAMKPGKAKVILKFGGVTLTHEYTVTELMVLDKDYLTLTKDGDAFGTLTARAETDESTEFSITVERYISEEENPDLYDYERWVEDNSFANIIHESYKSTYKDGMRTRYYKLVPGSKNGFGRVTFSYESDVLVDGSPRTQVLSATCHFDIQDMEALEISGFYGCDVWEALNDVDEWDGRSYKGIVYNGDEINADVFERGADIYYMAQYSETIPAEPTAEEIIKAGNILENPYIINSKTGVGYLRFSAVAHKKQMADSRVITAVLKFGYGDEDYDPASNWRDVIEDDRKLFDNDMSKVIGSGLVVSNEVEFWYDEEEGKYVCDDSVRNPGGAYYYTGSKLEFGDDIRVYYDGFRLLQGIDYEVAFYNNVNVCDGDLNNSKAPYFTVKLAGEKKPAVKMPFSIIKRSIKDVSIYSDPQVAVFQGDKFTEKSIAPEAVLETRYAYRTLKLGKDYKITYYKDTETGIDFSKKLTFNDVKNVPGDYIINLEGIGGFDGALIEKQSDPQKIMLKILPKESKKGTLSLSKAKLNKKLNYAFELDEKGDPVIQSQKLIKSLADGENVLKIGKKELKYMTEEKFKTLSDEEKKFEYYYSVFDPATEPDGEMSNRYPGYASISIHPFSFDDPNPDKRYSSKLVGSYRLEFDIKGISLAVTNVATTLEFDNYQSVAVFDEYGNLDKEKTLAKLAKSPDKPVKVVNKATGEPLSPDCYDLWINDDDGRVGVKTVEFYGIYAKGVENAVTKKIKIKAQKITEDNVTTSWETFGAKEILVDVPDYYKDDKGNIVVPYSKTGAKPEVYVYKHGEGDDYWYLAEGEDYTVSYSNNTKPGNTGAVTVKFKGNYSGTIKKVLTFKVGPKDFTLDMGNIEAQAKDVKWVKDKANNFKSSLVLYDNGKKLTAGKDFTIVPGTLQYTYGKDTAMYWQNGDLAEYISRGTPIPEGSSVPAGTYVEVSFRAVPKNVKSYCLRPEDEKDGAWFYARYYVGHDINACKVTVADQSYVAYKGVIPRKADITVYDPKMDFTLTGDYFEIVEVTNNYSVGTATVTIRGTGTWCGTKKVKFKIVNKVENANKKS